jgi:CRP-like cAMP-binding protein
MGARYRDHVAAARARRRENGPRRHLVVHASHEELAETVASVREVVTRTLDQLVLEGLVETARDEIVVLDPVRLSQEVSGSTEVCV